MKSFSTDQKWIQAPDRFKLESPYIKALPLRPISDSSIEYQIMISGKAEKVEIDNENTYLMSNGCLFDDMCDMDILNEPEVLNNLNERYKEDKIFTYIGPTLVVMNPYRVLPQYFSNEMMLSIRNKIITNSIQGTSPHIYLIAGNAYNSMIDQERKQAIVISGESGAGKTESTKYCMQLLTSLSHQDTHPIEAKILACNPILEAFGNSKTTRNDNSSRFGKYVQIFFANDHTIVGANINSYLLEKSRVVSTAEKERNFHIFYALIASGIMPLENNESYSILSRSKTYEATGINDKQYFKEIEESMNSIGFTKKEQTRIWELLRSILELGNVEFNDSVHREDESKACEIIEKSKKYLENLAVLLNIKEADLEKILLYEKKRFLKEFTLSPYNKNKCIANANTLSKAIYNAIFEFLLHKIQRSLRPQNSNNKEYISINILDIFGFENFDTNSFEQFCINFTNEKLLKLYNQYIFEREMRILKEDGLDQHISSIKPPTNERIIETMCGKISLFSIINDYTLPIQFKDSDIIQGFENKLSKSLCLEFDKINKNKFTILHSQCNVKYDINGFKEKNQDKVLPEIAEIVNNLFENDNKDIAGKTLLTKFNKEIDDLMLELTTSNVHFIRCIKPNQKKMPKNVEEKYVLTQVRYLGVFETIQIRKKTFPSRWIYEEFVQRFEMLFPKSKGTNQEKTTKIMNLLTKDPKDYLLGNQRIYMNSELESKLLKKLHEAMKKKVENCKLILKSYRKYKWRKNLKTKLHLLATRIRIWKKLANKAGLEIRKTVFMKIQECANKKLEEEKAAKTKKLMESKSHREKEEMKMKEEKIMKRSSILPEFVSTLQQIIFKNYSFFFSLCKNYSKNPSQLRQNSTGVSNYESNKSVDFDLNETMYVSDSSNPDDNKYERNPRPKTDSTGEEYEMNDSYLSEKSIISNERNPFIAFEGSIKVPMFYEEEAKGLKKLKLIYSEKFKPEVSESSDDHLSPPSNDAKFLIEDTPNEYMKRIVEFDSKTFFKRILRKRTNFFGIEKDEDDILVVKNKPLSKSLTKLEEEDEKDAIKIFKEILKVAEEPKLEQVFQQVERILFLCRKASEELINEVLLQLIKQSNTTNESTSIRTIQALIVFLHVYDPDEDFIFAALNFIFKKLAENTFSERQSEYFRYTYRKMIRKLEIKTEIGFMPIKYQIMALMCKRIISVPIHLPIGSGTHVKVESYETLADIKQRAMEEFGINSKRLNPDLFTFFELTNFPVGTSEERPLPEKVNVWDLVSYWNRSGIKYAEENENPPSFFLVLKIRYAYECLEEDEESVEIMFGQTFFDFYMGRIRVPFIEVCGLAACIKLIQYPNEPDGEWKKCFPEWAFNSFKEEALKKEMKEAEIRLSKALKENRSKNEKRFLKFTFLKYSEDAPLSLALSISTEQQIKLHFRNKMMYLTDDHEVIEAIPLKSIVKYADKENEFIFSTRNSSQSKIIYTEHGSICVKYMTMLRDLVVGKFT